MKILIKRAYEKPSRNDGYRVLVDRLWPRGIRKEELPLDEWCKDIAPSPKLRTWFNHDPKKFDSFAKKYQAELDRSPAPKALLLRANKRKSLTLVYAAKDPEINHARVLQAYLQKHT
jgi:uncharacterized protein YeaO (DUF488 family)